MLLWKRMKAGQKAGQKPATAAAGSAFWPALAALPGSGIRPCRNKHSAGSGSSPWLRTASPCVLQRIQCHNSRQGDPRSIGLQQATQRGGSPFPPTAAASSAPPSMQHPRGGTHLLGRATGGGPSPAPAPPAGAADAAPVGRRVAELEAAVAALHREAQQLNKQPGQEAAATAVYRQLAQLDDEALDLSLAQPPSAASPRRRAEHAAAHPAYCGGPTPPPTWAGAAALAPSCGWKGAAAAPLRQRSVLMVEGAALGDAAAAAVQWVYSEQQLLVLAQGERGANAGGGRQGPGEDAEKRTDQGPFTVSLAQYACTGRCPHGALPLPLGKPAPTTMTRLCEV